MRRQVGGPGCRERINRLLAGQRLQTVACGGGGGGGGAVGLSPSLGARVPSLAQYLRERSSQRRRRSGLPERLGEAALAPMGPFSPSALGASARRGRMSKSPVLVLKREQMLESEGAGGGGGGGGSNDALIEVADENDGC